MRRELSVLTAAATLVGCLLSAVPADAQWTVVDPGTLGTSGVPQLRAPKVRWGRPMHLLLERARPNATVWFGVGLSRVDVPLFGGKLVPNPELIFSARADGSGRAHIAIPTPNLCNLRVDVYAQALVVDPVAVGGHAWSSAGRAKIRDLVPSDFNGDGLTDLAIGAPDDDFGGRADVGRVDIVYGRKNGLPVLGTTIRQGQSLGGGTVMGAAEAGDRFGTAIAVGDFDGDGFHDMAVGVPRESIESANLSQSGVVHAIYGGPGGLQGANDALFRQGVAGMQDASESFDWFGKSLAVGDFNADGYDDLAVSAPYEDGIRVNGGIVQTIYGSPIGLTTAGNRVYNASTTDGRFGWSLAAGDFDRNGYSDLAVGRPYYDAAGRQDAGAVSILSFRPASYSLRTFDQSSTLGGVGIAGVAEAFDLFGFSLSAGDFDGNGTDDLAIGVPFEDIGSPTISAAGAVNVVYGRQGVGLDGAGNQVWTQSSTGLAGSPNLAEYFGYSLASGDFDDDGRCDLAIGVPRDMIGTARAGSVQILPGRKGVGVDALGGRLLHQRVTGMVNNATANDNFGWALFAGDINGDCKFDLVIGVPGETFRGQANAGAVHVMYGNTTGLTVTGNELWGNPSTGANERLGASTATSNDQKPL